MSSSHPYYENVPKTLAANARYRRNVMKLAFGNPEAQRELWMACSRDILFYINVFGYTYNPKRKGSKVIPMITWGYQDESIIAMEESLDMPEDLMIEKSRDMGASWLMLYMFKHRWHFRDWQSFLLLSRKEDLVDKSDDPDCLFWKIDFMLKYDPVWLRPDYERKTLQLTNLSNGSTISGESTNSDAGRGGRKTAIAIDEFAAVDNGDEIERATADTTGCRFFASTPKGVGNAFYRKRQSQIRRLTFHWSQHPEKSLGLYRPGRHGPQIIDHQFWNQYFNGQVYLDPDDQSKPYEFSAETPRGPFGLRSVWYDKECVRRASRTQVAQELDIDYQGSGSQFFDAIDIEKVKTLYAAPPFLRGRLEFDRDTCEPIRFQPDPIGPVLLWMHLDQNGNPPPKKYAMGADIATGSRNAQGFGASNSVISAGDKNTQTKVLEFAVASMGPVEFAKYGVAIAKWLGDAQMCWEANGPGRSFGDAVYDLGYRNIFYRENEEKLAKGSVFSGIPGWMSTRGTKEVLLTDYRQALQSCRFVNRSEWALDETLDYVFDESGGISNAKSRNDSDPTGAKDNHGDRVIADALLWKMVRRPIGEKLRDDSEWESEKHPPQGSYGYRRRQWESSQKDPKLY